MQDNAPVHTAKKCKAFFEEQEIPLLPRPPSFPDINPIENLWATMKPRLANRRTEATKDEDF